MSSMVVYYESNKLVKGNVKCTSISIANKEENKLNE